MRVKSTWHKTQVKTIDDIAGALAFNAWRITKNHLEDLINEAYVIEKEQVFNVIQEYLCYLIQCVDRLSFDILDAKKRQELVIALAKQSADYYHENKGERMARELAGARLLRSHPLVKFRCQVAIARGCFGGA